MKKYTVRITLSWFKTVGYNGTRTVFCFENCSYLLLFKKNSILVQSSDLINFANSNSRSKQFSKQSTVSHSIQLIMLRLDNSYLYWFLLLIWKPFNRLHLGVNLSLRTTCPPEHLPYWDKTCGAFVLVGWVSLPNFNQDLVIICRFLAEFMVEQITLSDPV